MASVVSTSENRTKDEKSLQEKWREIQGSNNWKGLLDPMNSHLRSEIIRYGEFSQCCYDAFDKDPRSKYCGSCKYEGPQFFEKLDMADQGYELCRYLYATSNINLAKFFQKSNISDVWSKHANWMGYVAVLKDPNEIKRLGRRDIVVAWRGTVTHVEWIHNLKTSVVSPNFGRDPEVKMLAGFFDLYTDKEKDCNFCSFSAREQVLAEIKRLVDRYKGEELSITITGHSLGGALALMSVYDLAEMKVSVVDGSQIPITVFSFCAPRVGNLRFKERCKELNVKVLRVVNARDIVPKFPDPFQWSYAYVGVELMLYHTNSPFLKATFDLVCSHNLEVLLHLIDGYHGKGHKFSLDNKRDIALVNKDGDFLRDEYCVPPQWKQDPNKGMVRNVEGKWIIPERTIESTNSYFIAQYLEQVIKQEKSPMGSLHGSRL
ncbi:phospholipase A1-Igamma3, chloroplastic-like [Tasmannia lanceolata]|uniref:phospholipase A1-Igamma3, chloroplastic-like n=1 Tax=Tasmannia lanceolata TaxID=3420 RepID=UPI004062FC37